MAFAKAALEDINDYDATQHAGSPTGLRYLNSLGTTDISRKWLTDKGGTFIAEYLSAAKDYFDYAPFWKDVVMQGYSIIEPDSVFNQNGLEHQDLNSCLLNHEGLMWSVAMRKLMLYLSSSVTQADVSAYNRVASDSFVIRLGDLAPLLLAPKILSASASHYPGRDNPIMDDLVAFYWHLRDAFKITPEQVEYPAALKNRFKSIAHYDLNFDLLDLYEPTSGGTKWQLLPSSLKVINNSLMMTGNESSLMPSAKAALNALVSSQPDYWLKAIHAQDANLIRGYAIAYGSAFAIIQSGYNEISYLNPVPGPFSGFISAAAGQFIHDCKYLVSRVIPIIT